MSRRVLVVQPILAPAGGAEAVAAWMIEALKDDHDVGIVTWTPPDFDAVNRWYGTSIRASQVRVHAARAGLRGFVDAMPVRLALVRAAIVFRMARGLASAYDVVISADNEVDLGRPAVQYVHYPRFLRPRPAGDLRWFHRWPGVLKLYYRLCDLLIGGATERIARNGTFANSAWTADRVRALYPDAAVTVVPPPVMSDDTGGLPWEDRENGFLCIGRLSAEKEIERIVEIVAGVRRAVPDVRLHIAGSRQSKAEYRAVRRLAETHAAWIRVHEDLSRVDLLRLIGRQRYGIHAMRDEHFGIAPAEMVRGGCIVFVPDSGGQVDVVGGEERLLFGDVREAVAKIVAVITDAGEQRRLRAHLSAGAGRYSVERFMRTIREAVRC